MSAGVQVTGLDELLRTLTGAADEIREQGMVIVREETEQAARDITQHYPEQSRTAQGTGTLKRSVRTSYPAQGLALMGIVRSAAPHAHLWEFGTRQRSFNGKNRGVMPATPTTPGIAEIRRARMYRRLAEMLRAMGFEVSGV